jgi:hypothetical protein
VYQGGAYVNVWSSIGYSLENNLAMATIVGKLVYQVKLNATAVARINHVNMESVQLKI